MKALKRIIRSNWAYNWSQKILKFRVSESSNRLTPDHLKHIGWTFHDGFWYDTDIKERDRVWIKFERTYYRVWHGRDRIDRTFIALENTVEWLQNYLLLVWSPRFDEQSYRIKNMHNIGVELQSPVISNKSRTQWHKTYREKWYEELISKSKGVVTHCGIPVILTDLIIENEIECKSTGYQLSVLLGEISFHKIEMTEIKHSYDRFYHQITEHKNNNVNQTICDWLKQEGRSDLVQNCWYAEH